ncbi:hypothetical protein KC331_g21886 [Hortaea werneckii]|nr:hypothetical protein KC331_g21886 [Hortaea werneckii]KAI7681356.1 hypothetical protein KC353_g21890 [Hortaea werneckii]
MWHRSASTTRNRHLLAQHMGLRTASAMAFWGTSVLPNLLLRQSRPLRRQQVLMSQTTLVSKIGSRDFAGRKDRAITVEPEG